MYKTEWYPWNKNTKRAHTRRCHGVRVLIKLKANKAVRKTGKAVYHSVAGEARKDRDVRSASSSHKLHLPALTTEESIDNDPCLSPLFLAANSTKQRPRGEPTRLLQIYPMQNNIKATPPFDGHQEQKGWTM
jgi:hypothetical protein